jgi:hypothetical protein
MGNQKSPSVVAKRHRSKRHGTPAESLEDDVVEDQSEDEESIQPVQKSRQTNSPVEPAEANLNVTSSSPVPQPKPKPAKKSTAAAVKKAAEKGKNKKAASDTETEKENSELEPIRLKDNQ